ncbi:hypothetical protein RB595_004221 [Gaeumannomyces hyphopodioides]
MQRRMLSREEEEAAGDEVEVRREDQDKINRFSRLHQRELTIEDELKAKNKEKEELDDVSAELELADEDETVPTQKKQIQGRRCLLPRVPAPGPGDAGHLGLQA